MPPTPQDRPDVEVFSEIGVIEHCLRNSVARFLPPGMTYTQFEVLLHFVRNGDGATPAELARDMLMSKAAITNTLQRMQAQGTVVVLADVNDRRKKRVRLTRVGLDAYSAILKAMKPKTDTLREAFTEGEFRAALPFLRALRVFLEDVTELDEPAAASR